MIGSGVSIMSMAVPAMFKGAFEFLIGPGVTILCVAIVVQIVLNHRSMPVARPSAVRPPAPVLVSVLVPARDEAATIGACIASILAQGHEMLEVIVADDRSVDETAAIVAGFDDPRLRLVRTGDLPAGWTGKNWAADLLAGHASGEVLCFVDADTVLAPDAIGAALDVLIASEAGLVSMLPATDYQATSEAVMMPMVGHGILALMPLWLVHSRVLPGVALAIGPFLMVTRAAYDEVGGHASAPDEIVDDVRLARAVKSVGHRVRVVNGTDLVRTRWYPSLAGIWNGFTKNAFGGIGSNMTIALLAGVVALPLLLAPFVRVGVGLMTGSVALDALAQVVVLLSARAITSSMARDPQWSTPLHPLTIAFWGATLAWSTMLSVTDRSVDWRGRSVPVRSRNH